MRKKTKKCCTRKRGLGQSAPIALFVETNSDFARQKGVVQTALAEIACRGEFAHTAAEKHFAPLVAAAAKKLGSSATEQKQALEALIADFRQDAKNCVESPFCNLPPQAEKILTSGKCKLR